jgi:hypothetical protein
MAARKYGRLGKMLTGVFVTFVAPVLANVAAQQVGDWQQTLKYLVENESPAATADWNRPIPQSVGVGNNRFTAENAENAENAEKYKTILQCIPLRSPRSPR